MRSTTRCISRIAGSSPGSEALEFERAAALVGQDPVLTRMLRNYRTMHLLNQRRTRQALAELDKPVPRELLARINAVLRRAMPASPACR